MRRAEDDRARPPPPPPPRIPANGARTSEFTSQSGVPFVAQLSPSAAPYASYVCVATRDGGVTWIPHASGSAYVPAGAPIGGQPGVATAADAGRGGGRGGGGRGKRERPESERVGGGRGRGGVGTSSGAGKRAKTTDGGWR